jgi:hypothetical protein
MPIDMNALARVGATARLTELRQELANLHAAFPDLDGASAPRKQRRRTRQAAPAVSDNQARKRKGMPAAARKAARERMRAYWAARKATATAPASIVETADTKVTSTPEAPKRTMSAEARARISAAQKKRWRAQKRGEKR